MGRPGRGEITAPYTGGPRVARSRHIGANGLNIATLAPRFDGIQLSISNGLFEPQAFTKK